VSDLLGEPGDRGLYRCTIAAHSSLRASDADRDAVAERLRRAAVEGRLEPEELEERLHAALRARTYGDLQPLLNDLPAQPAAWKRTRAPAPRAVLGVTLRVVLALAVVAVALVVAAMMATWWVLWALIWFAVRGRGRGCFGAHCSQRSRAVQRRRLAGMR
jgi:hypothetical protein